MRVFLGAALLAWAAAALPAPLRTPHVEAELVAERTAVAPGQPLTVALRLKAIPGWQTYWRNPGDSGQPTAIEWKLPPGYEAGAIHWPEPHKLPIGPLANYGY
jgi:thiol:disulfide interchange protein DsbD